MRKSYLSKYLIFIELQDSTLLFNGFSGNMDLVRTEFAVKLKNLHVDSDAGFLSTSELEFMKKRGHITDLAPENERAAFKKLAMDVHSAGFKSARKTGFLSLLMSYGCNLTCPYCYQAGVRAKRGPARMSEELLESLLGKHYDALFPGVEPKDLTISLYGGEPFLRTNVPLIKRVIRFAEKSNIRISAISNSTDIVGVRDFLGPLPGNITAVQVTLDTSIKGQDGARSKGRQFEEIIDNIHFMLDKKVNVSIRMHVNEDNYQELSSVVDYLVDQEIATHPFCYAYLAPIREHTDPGVKDQHLNIKSDIFREIGEKLGHPLNLEVENLQTLLASRERRLTKTAFCMLGQSNAYVADPFGDLYGCLEEAGDEDVRIGHVDSDKVSFLGMNEIYLKRNICNLDKCLDCPFALLCGGGCPYHAKRLNGSVLEPDCYDIKESLIEAIKYAYTNGTKAREIRFPA
jgi:uncharacterized protein